VVGGFQRGDWNEYGRYFMVRLRDAHAWVEAHVEGAGWITLDPTPRALADAGRRPLGHYLDALRLRWYRYVINWSLRDQIETALTIRRHAVAWKPWMAGAGPWSVPRPGLVLLGAVAAGAVLTAATWWGRRWLPAANRPERVPRFYARALAALARRGLRPAPAETAREFCHRVGRDAPGAGAALGRITAVYERCRFAGRPPAPAETAELDACLRILRRP
jgi:hypothetical protein